MHRWNLPNLGNQKLLLRLTWYVHSMSSNPFISPETTCSAGQLLAASPTWIRKYRSLSSHLNLKLRVNWHAEVILNRKWWKKRPKNYHPTLNFIRVPCQRRTIFSTDIRRPIHRSSFAHAQSIPLFKLNVINVTQKEIVMGASRSCRIVSMFVSHGFGANLMIRENENNNNRHKNDLRAHTP